ncbi:MAG: YhcB family protein [bacterium]|nr:YhcB family protein [bacterium]
MALQLKNKVKEEKPEVEKGKKGKYKRKRNVFGKRLTRFGLIGLIVGLIIAFAIIKVTFTLTQNKRQKKIDEDLVQVNAKIDEYRTELGKKQDSYANVGELIATLPTSFDQQATSLDLDRMIILSGLSESSSNIRKIVEVSTLPVESSVSTVKAVQISFVLYGKVDDVESALKFMNYLTDYSHENFYYIEKFNYTEDRSIFKRSSLDLTIYTFYNDVELKPVETNTDTNTQTK